VIKNDADFATLAQLITANGLVSAVDKTGIVVFAPTNAQLADLANSGVPQTSCLVTKTLAHHVVSSASLTAGTLQTLNPTSPIVVEGSGSR
jgi:uncharacterized surface protein with fasciclin (FAS1) repeats